MSILRRDYEAKRVNDERFANTTDPEEATKAAHVAADLDHDIEDQLQTLYTTHLCPTCPYHDGNKVLVDTVGEEG